MNPTNSIINPKVTTAHQAKQAYVYVRQSSLSQVVQHGESTELQYQLVERAILLGWPRERVHVIDEDLGKSGAGSDQRQGFQFLIAEIGLGHVGLVLSFDASRLARNNSDWHRLIELCSLFATLIADGEQLYDPLLYHDRLLLGLSGMMSEAELLDPIYESDFQPYSFGFRKGRCTMDAIAVLMPLANTSIKHYYVIEGDLKSYFDTVNHRILLRLLKKRIMDRKLLNLIHRFLTAGVMDNQLFAETKDGVPQGSICSPLLANLYLNEFDQWARRKWEFPQYERQKIRKAGRGNYVMVRYADDFVVVSNDAIDGVKQAKEDIKAFLEDELKLTLSEEKTLITHVNKGYDFLGFHIRRVKPEGRWVVHLRPTQKSVQHVKAKIKALTGRNQTLYDEVTKMKQLNQVVRGWCEYYKHTSLQSDLSRLPKVLS